MKWMLRWFGADNNAGYNTVKDKLEQKLPNSGVNAEMDATGVINYFLYAGGIIAVIMIIVAGVQMTASAGDAGAVAKAKKTMTFAIIGLIIMILAYAIINFVIGKL